MALIHESVVILYYSMNSVILWRPKERVKFLVESETASLSQNSLSSGPSNSEMRYFNIEDLLWCVIEIEI